MHAALRPYVTIGIAIVGASVIAVAPVTVPPPALPSVDVVAVEAVRTVSADVDLTALADVLAAFPQAAAVVVQLILQAVPLPAEVESLVMALANAGVPAVTETVKLFTETLPATAQTLIAAGKFAHLPVLAVQTVLLGVLTPPAQYLSVLVQELPMPFGTPDGLIDESFKLLVQTPMLAGITILNLLADVFDSGLSPVTALSGTIDAISAAIASAMESIGKIAAALGGALPFAGLAPPPQAPDNARTMAVVADVPAVDDTDSVASSLNSTSSEDVSAAVTVTVTVDEPAPQVPEQASAPFPEAEPEKEATDDDVMANGATDLTDGNKAEPDGTLDEEADESDAVEDDTTVVEDVPDEQSATPNEASTGSDEGSGADSDSPGE